MFLIYTCELFKSRDLILLKGSTLPVGPPLQEGTPVHQNIATAEEV